MKFQGYQRENGAVGVRNHLLVLASVSCANGVVEAIGRELPGVVPVGAAQEAPSAVQSAVSTLMPQGKPSWLRPAPVEGMWEVAFGPHIFYISYPG